MGHFVPPPVSNRSLLPSARSSLQSSRLRRLRNEGDGRVNEVSETVTEGRRQRRRDVRGTQGRDEDRTEVMTIRDEVSGAGSLGSFHTSSLSVPPLLTIDPER